MHRILLFVAVAATLTACSGGHTTDANDTDNAEVDTLARSETLDPVTRQYLQSITDCVANGDAHTFASLCKYPVWRSYPLRWIEDSAQMVEYFPILVDENFRQVCRDITPDDWWQAGWRGYSFADGSYIWDDYGSISINYMSAAEEALIEILSRQEIESLHPSLRTGGWQPYFCFIDEEDSTLYRIDFISNPSEPDDNQYRLAVYPRGYDLGGQPYTLMKGSRSEEGTSHVQRLLFYNDNDETLNFIYDPSERERRVPAHINLRGTKATHPIHLIYWRDYTTLR